MNRIKNNFWALACIGLVSSCQGMGGNREDVSSQGLVTLAEKGQQSVNIRQPDLPEFKSVADELNDFFTERGYSVTASAEKESQMQMTLATEKHFGKSLLPKSHTEEIKAFFASSRDDAYVLYIDNKEVLLVGKTVAGLRAAVERFRAKVANDGEVLKIKSGLEKNNPFISGRLVNVGDSPRRQTPYGSPFKDAGPEVWDAEKLFTYPELYRQFGFSGIQIGECRGYGTLVGKELEKAQKGAVLLAQGAKKSGMMVSWFVWGDALFDEFEVICWSDSEEHKVITDFHREQADRYGKYVDHVNVHISDPGGCNRNGCDPYKTRQELANYIVGEFRRINPAVEGNLSTWANGAFWLHAPEPVGLENYFSVFLPPPDQIKFSKPIPDGAKFLDGTFMPKDMGIALNRFYQADQAKLVVESGRPLDVWGWYISDHEMRNNMAFNMKNIDLYFRALPPEAGEQIRYYNAEINFHGWPHIINAYVTAQKMWDPKRSLEEMELEFCTATFGPENAVTMVALYNAVEGGYDAMIPRPDDFGTADYNQHLRDVLKEAQKVHLAADWKPNFSFADPASKYVDMLVARLRLILAVSDATEQVNAARAGMEGDATRNNAKALVFQGLDANGSQVVSTPLSSKTLKLNPGHTMGQTFHVIRDFSKVGIQVGTWSATNAGLTLSLYDKVGGTLEATAEFSNVLDNGWIWLESESRFPSGSHYLELSKPTGDAISVYVAPDKVQPDALVYFDREPVSDEDAAIREIKAEAIKNLPHLPIDPIYKQDETIVHPTYKTRTFAEMIEQL